MLLIIRSQSKMDLNKLLASWCALALFSLLEHFIAPFKIIFALYLLLKTAVLVYMLLPQTYGAHNCFVNYVQPMLERMAQRRRNNRAKGQLAGGGSKKDKKQKASKSSSGEQ
ncbi:hypothetical protein niasHS_014035 [Heterodera schachtii]|uniref:Receptor expression-enhancing protein n=1 Tax=Heterodera schachtii TaxID=97005 RepID=A0ABD2IK27_HETSC